jgi:hypothetical protein
MATSEDRLKELKQQFEEGLDAYLRATGERKLQIGQQLLRLKLEKEDLEG